MAARVCYAEAEFHYADCTAILHVARKRAERTGRTWQQELVRYSSFTRSHGKRAREIRRFSNGDVAGKGAEWNAKWQRLRELVRRFDAGDEPDTCTRAIGWGGRTDARKPGQIRVRCEVKTANWFYRVRGRA